MHNINSKEVFHPLEFFFIFEKVFSPLLNKYILNNKLLKRRDSMIKQMALIGMLCCSILYGSDVTNPEKSKINFLLSLDKNILDKIVNEEVPQSLNDYGNGKGFIEGLKWSYFLTRGDIDYQLQDNKLSVKAPISGDLKASMEGLSSNFNLKLSGTGGFESYLGIDPNWNFIISSSPTLELKKIELPFSIPFLGKSIKVTPNLDRVIYDALKYTLENSLEKMDEELQKFPLRKSIEEIWQTLNNPIPIDKEKNSWLTLKPTAVRYSGLNLYFDELQTCVMIDADVKVVMGEIPDSLNLGPLPSIDKAPAIPQFAINLPIEITYKEIESLVQSQLKQVTYSLFSGSEVHVRDISVLGDNKEMHVLVDFDSKLFWGLLKPKGILAVTGIPIIEKTESKVRFENLTYELDTDSYILKWISKLFKKSIIDWTNQALQNGVTQVILSTQTDLNQKLEEFSIDENIMLKGHLETLKLTNLETVSDRLIVDTYFDGEMNLKIKNLR